MIMNILDICLQATFLVKFIILILVIFSVLSWATIIQKISIIKVACNELKKFENKFWSGIEIPHLYRESQIRQSSLFGSEQIFYSGFKEFSRLYQINNNALEKIIEGTSRAMNISINKEIEILEAYIPFLGILGSISPYIGLLGTVWGIMHTFITLGEIKQVTLQVIVPSIAESLITTSIGLLVAIPAIIAHNCLSQYVNKLELSYSNFMEEFIAVLYRQLFNDIKIEG